MDPMNDADPLTDDELIAFANMLCGLKGEVICKVTYQNYRGEVSTRTITPKEVWYGSTEWHTEPCLLLKAFDHDKNAMRDFALAYFYSGTWEAA
jgi:predicted DNA-binding transcriptional regulator YafY